MSAIKNDRFLRALRREPVDSTPIWLMRQAGRYLPEYRETRRRAGDFLTLLRTPELACEVTLQPLRRFPLDAAIVFSDILALPDAMGLGLSVIEQAGPRFARPVQSEADIRALRAPAPERELAYVLDAIRLIRCELGGEVPLIGFCGSPWTVATYMVEGGSSKDFRVIKRLRYQRPDLLAHLLDVLAEASAAYLCAQVRAGADALMIFDTWGGVLEAADFLEYALGPVQRTIAAVRRATPGERVPIITFSKGCGQWLEAIPACGCDAVGIDWLQDLAEARRRVGGRVALQGNLDPAVLFAAPGEIRERAAAVLAAYGAGSGHVFNLGHGVHPDTDPAHVAALVEAVHDRSRAYHP